VPKDEILQRAVKRAEDLMSTGRPISCGEISALVDAGKEIKE
jgi:uncharacterized protein YoaH (UPF0181 family)